MNQLREPFFNASVTFYKKFLKRIEEIPDWEALKKGIQKIRNKNIEKLPELADKFEEKAKEAGSFVYRVSTAREAVEKVYEILREREAKLVVKAKSMVTEEIHLNRYLQEKGIEVVETDLGEWIVQLRGERPSHLTAPALHLTRRDIKKLFEEKLGIKASEDPQKLVRIAREKLREFFIKADAGITGVNFAIAETGSLVIISNEGNARLVSSLPPIHIAILTYDKLVETVEEAATLLKTLPKTSTGQNITAYVSFVTGPSRTADIEKQLVIGAHGPEEVHIILLDNGRLAAREDPLLREVLRCYKCGGCLLVCPVFQEMGGHLFGGDVYPGGIGLLFTAIVNPDFPLEKKLHLCAQCGKCVAFCPMEINTPEIIRTLRKKRFDPCRTLANLLFSKPFLFHRIFKLSAKTTSLFPRNFMELPFVGTILKREKGKISEKRGIGKRVFLFRGCMSREFFPSIIEKTSEFLARLGYEVVSPEEQVCCGGPAFHLGLEEKIQPFAEKNVRLFEKYNPAAILFLCPTGAHTLKELYPAIKSEYSKWAEKTCLLSEFLEREGIKLEIKEANKKVYFHHPCHSINYLGVKEAPLKALSSMGFEVIQDYPLELCCGFAGMFSLRHPLRSSAIGKRRLRQIKEADLIVTECPGCLFQLSRLSKDRDRVKHLAELLQEE